MVFTEPQVYHLLRVLNDETLIRLLSTMERMVFDVVRGAPTVAPSRTAHFHSRERAQTPGPRIVSNTSESETDSETVVSARSRICPAQEKWETHLFMKRVIALLKWTT